MIFIGLLLVFVVNMLIWAHAADWNMPRWVYVWRWPIGIGVILGLIYLLNRFEPNAVLLQLQQQYGEKTGRRVLMALLILFVAGVFGFAAFYDYQMWAISQAVKSGALER
jgi:hypothetical protein